VPTIRDLFESTYFAGLRKAEMPEEWRSVVLPARRSTKLRWSVAHSATSCRFFGFGLLDMARDVAAFNLPARVGQQTAQQICSKV